MITLIATCHKEKGKCDSNDLCKIIVQIKPDVIFEELSPDFFDKTYKDILPDTLETKAIKLHRTKYPIAHFPVDADVNMLIDKAFKNEFEYMLERFEHSPRFQEISIHLDELTYKYGFPFLNSNQCIDLFAERYLLEERLLKEINEEMVTKTFRRWIHILEVREKEMIKNIYNYCLWQYY